jgi:hypothetical protein
MSKSGSVIERGRGWKYCKEKWLRSKNRSDSERGRASYE